MLLLKNQHLVPTLVSEHSQPGFALQNTTPVRVPPTLDLAPYCSKDALPGKPRYELVAVANHMGSRGSGHCTADCRSAVDGQWYSCNDSTVQCSRYQEKPSQLVAVYLIADCDAKPLQLW